MRITSYGAAGEVTGSCHMVECGDTKILLDCGLIQGSMEDEARNALPFPFAPEKIDALILSHAHLDHSGRIPLLIKAGFKGPIYTQTASRDLCRIMLKDAAFINEKETEWNNRKRERKGLPPLQPLYTVEEAIAVVSGIKAVRYDESITINHNVSFRLRDAGHILGSAIVEVFLTDNGRKHTLVYSGDLGHRGAPILRDPAAITEADSVLLESTYGDRDHRPWQLTFDELRDILLHADQAKGNILIPAFAVGRTQELLYLFATHFEPWGLSRWQIFLDSPMAIEATAVYLKHAKLYDEEASKLWRPGQDNPLRGHLHFSRTGQQSMKLNSINSGAVIVAGSGMCTGGRIKHHLKHNVWRRGCHVIIIGFQGYNTLGRQLVDGAKEIRLWGEEIRVNAEIHTVGGLSAHAGQAGLIAWASHFTGNPRVLLVHGENSALEMLKVKLQSNGKNADIMRHGVVFALS